MFKVGMKTFSKLLELVTLEMDTKIFTLDDNFVLLTTIYGLIAQSFSRFSRMIIALSLLNPLNWFDFYWLSVLIDHQLIRSFSSSSSMMMMPFFFWSSQNGRVVFFCKKKPSTSKLSVNVFGFLFSHLSIGDSIRFHHFAFTIMMMVMVKRMRAVVVEISKLNLKSSRI